MKNNPRDAETNSSCAVWRQARRSSGGIAIECISCRAWRRPLSDEFMRQYVSLTSTGRILAQAPAHLFDTPTGKLYSIPEMGFNTSRMANREYIAPMIRAFPETVAWRIKATASCAMSQHLAAGAGAGTSLQMTLNALYHRDERSQV